MSLSFIRGLVAAVNPCGFILLPTYLSACVSWQAQEASPEQVIGPLRPPRWIRRALAHLHGGIRPKSLSGTQLRVPTVAPRHAAVKLHHPDVN